MHSEPWTKRFAFVIAASVGFVRQAIEPTFVEAFDTYYSKNIASKAFRLVIASQIVTASHASAWKSFDISRTFGLHDTHSCALWHCCSCACTGQQVPTLYDGKNILCYTILPSQLDSPWVLLCELWDGSSSSDWLFAIACRSEIYWGSPVICCQPSAFPSCKLTYIEHPIQCALLDIFQFCFVCLSYCV